MSSVASCSACSRGGVKNYKKRRHFVALSLFWCACSLFALHAGQLIRRCLLTSFKFTKKHSARTQGRNFHFFSPKSVDTSRLKSCDARLVDLKGKLVVNALLLQCFFFFFIGAESFFFFWPSIVFFCLETGALLTEDAPAFWCPRRRLRQAYANAHTDGSAQERRKRAFFFSLFFIINEYNCFYTSHIRKHCGTKAGSG